MLDLKSNISVGERNRRVTERARLLTDWQPVKEADQRIRERK